MKNSPTSGCPESFKREFLARALSAGACAVIARPFTTDEIIGAIKAAVTSGIYLPHAAAALVMHAEPSAAGTTMSRGLLTHRQMQILRLQAEGLLYKEIAARLGLSEHTVNNHLYEVRQKLGVRTGIEAVNRVFHLDMTATAP